MAKQMRLKLGITWGYGWESLHKKFEGQWANINNTYFTKCYSALSLQREAMLKT